MNPLFLGKTQLPSNVLLAPMAGVTDLPFRNIVKKFGNFLMFSEMVASNAVIRKVSRTYKMIEGADDPFTSVQIVGGDPDVMADAAKLSVDLGAKFIDINMGCPVKKIVRSDAGSALMKDEKLAASIIESIVNAVNVPVTLKIRLGWDCNHKNSPQIARIAEDIGIQMVTVHGRTRSQLYTGKADWMAIRKVKEAVKNIPVIANGDIIDIASAIQALHESDADGIMIGRGSLGSPWILQHIHDFLTNHQENSSQTFDLSQKYAIAKEHLSYVSDFYPYPRSVSLSKKILMYYSKGIPNAASFRRNIVNITSIADASSLLTQMFESSYE